MAGVVTRRSWLARAFTPLVLAPPEDRAPAEWRQRGDKRSAATLMISTAQFSAGVFTPLSNCYVIPHGYMPRNLAELTH